MARTPVPGRPSQVRRRDRVQHAGHPVLPARQFARPPCRLELGQISRRAAVDLSPPSRPPYGRRSLARAPHPCRPVLSTTARTAGRRSLSRPGPSPAISGDRVPAMTRTRRDRLRWMTTTGPAGAAVLSAVETAAPDRQRGVFRQGVFDQGVPARLLTVTARAGRCSHRSACPLSPDARVEHDGTRAEHSGAGD